MDAANLSSTIIHSRIPFFSISLFPALLYTLLVFISPAAFSQDQWLNFTNSTEVKDVVFWNGYAWAATGGGLMRVDLETNQQLLINPSNSEIPSNNISFIYLDPDSYIWIGTYGQGIARFNGNEWTPFDERMNGLKSDRVLSMCADNAGILWIGTEMGINRYYNGGIHSDWDIQGIIQDIILDSTGVLWIGSSGGLVRIKDCKISSFEGQVSKPVPFFDVRNFVLGKNNDVWMLARAGVVVYSNGVYSLFNPPLKDLRKGNPVSFALDPDYNVWLGFINGIARFKGGVIETFDNDVNKPKGRVNKIKIDDAGRTWVCTDKGLFVYDTAWTFIKTSNSIITSNQSLKIYSDRYKNIWFRNGGDLLFFGRDTIIHFTKSDGFAGMNSFAEDKNGDLWFGHWNGLTRYNGKAWKEIDTLSRIIKKRDKEIFEKYKDTSWVKENYKLHLLWSDMYFDPGYFVSPMHIDGENNLWLKADTYLLKYDQKNWTVYDEFDSGIPTGDITAITSDSKNQLWIGTFKHGLYEFDGEEFTSCLSSGTFTDSNIVSLYNFNDTLVVSTSKQVVFFENGELRDDNRGVFISPYVRDVFRDSKGNYWFGSQYGLFEFSSPVKRALYDTYNSGLASNYVSSINEDYSGNLWILTSTGGVNIFNENGIGDEQKIIYLFTQKGTVSSE